MVYSIEVKNFVGVAGQAVIVLISATGLTLRMAAYTY